MTLSSPTRATYPSAPRSRGLSLARHWMLWFSLLFGLYVGLPFLAPALMALGLELPARLIYAIYSFLCHQLPERSYFLFGPQISYSPAEISSVWAADNLMTWRSFTGSAAMGWKVAWSDRMVSMFTSILLFGWLWWPLRRWLPALRWPGLVLLLLPMTLDGFTHMFSDFTGMYEGFRYTNQWLAQLTAYRLPETFYAGDAVGSFNSWMRLISGVLFGLGVAWFGFPIIDRSFQAELLYHQARQRLHEMRETKSSPTAHAFDEEQK